MTLNIRGVYILLSQLLITAASTCGVVSGQEAPLDLQQILIEMDKTQAMFDPKSSYRLSWREDLRDFKTDGTEMPGKRTEVENARKGEMLFVHIVQQFVNSDEITDMTIYFKDGVSSMRQRDGIQIFPHMLSQFDSYNWYTNGLWVNVMDGLKWGSPQLLESYDGLEPSDTFRPVCLPHAIRVNPEQYQLLSEKEEYLGVACWVIENKGVERILIDPTHSYLPVKRTFFVHGQIANVSEMSDFFEQRPGAWLPRKLSGSNYHGLDAENSPHAGKLARTRKLVLKDIDFKDLADDFFDIPIPSDERILVSDIGRKIEYWKHPDGSDPVQNVIADVHRRSEMQGGSISKDETKTWLFLLNGIFLGCVAGFLLFRQLRR